MECQTLGRLLTDAGQAFQFVDQFSYRLCVLEHR